MHTRPEKKGKYGKTPGVAIRRSVVAALLVTIVLCGAWDAARAQSGTPEDRKGVMITIDTVFEGWRKLDLGLYMSAWDYGAVQYLQKGITRNYNQIRADRADAFPKYSRVDATWSAESVEIYGNKAYVVVRYSMTFYKKNGKVLTENEKEFYVLEKKPDMMWSIVENYDYLPKR